MQCQPYGRAGADDSVQGITAATTLPQINTTASFSMIYNLLVLKLYKAACEKISHREERAGTPAEAGWVVAVEFTIKNTGQQQ